MSSTRGVLALGPVGAAESSQRHSVADAATDDDHRFATHSAIQHDLRQQSVKCASSLSDPSHEVEPTSRTTPCARVDVEEHFQMVTHESNRTRHDVITPSARLSRKTCKCLDRSTGGRRAGRLPPRRPNVDAGQCGGALGTFAQLFG